MIDLNRKNAGAVILAMFAPDVRKELVDFVLSTGSDALAQADTAAVSVVQTDPCLSFLHTNIPVEALVNISRALRIVLGDALAGQWDVDQYALALSRASSVPPDEARRLATEFIVTKDASVLSWARRMLNAIPNLPGPFDEAAKGVLGGVLNVLDSIIPLDWVNSSGDVLYEWHNMGDVLGRLALRAKLVVAEVTYEKEQIPEDKKPELRDAAASALPLLAKAVIGLLTSGAEAGDLDDGTHRLMVADLANEVGDLYSELYHMPENGSIGSFLRKVGRTAGRVANAVVKVGLPLAGAAVAGPAGLVAGGALTKALGGDRNAKVIHAAADRTATLPRPALEVDTRTTLSGVLRSVKSLQNAGVDINK